MRTGRSGRFARWCRRTPGSSSRTIRRRPRRCSSGWSRTGRTTAGCARDSARCVGLDAPEADPEENYAAWLQFLREVTAHRPLVLVLEDLHWADEALLAFVDYVAVHAADLPMLLVATARPVAFEQHPAFAASGGRVTRIWLDRLSDDETRALVTSLPEMEGREARRWTWSRSGPTATPSSPRSSPSCSRRAAETPTWRRCPSPSRRCWRRASTRSPSRPRARWPTPP